MRNAVWALLLVLAACLASLALFPSARQVTRLVNASNVDSYSVLGQATITPTYINQVLCSASSPACGTGQALYSGGVHAGIDPTYALAFFKHESSYGRYGVARSTHGLGNIRCSPGYLCLDGFRVYATWEAGYIDWYNLISWYCSDLHKCSIEQIIPTYAPASENDTQGYIVSVEQAVDAFRKDA